MENLVNFFQMLLIFLVLGTILVAGLIVAGYFFLHFWRYRKREEYSLDFVLLQVTPPRENEIKIDAAEQMFASLYSLRRGGYFSFLRPQEHLSFEIVGLPEEIRFFVSCPLRLRDLVEKQINAAYPGAEIKEVDEYNIFSESGKVAFVSLKLRSANFNPIKTFKDLPTDPLSSVTSALAKMQAGEGAAVQIIISPADNKWRGMGKSFVNKTKASEAKGEGKFFADPKAIEAIENKCSKVGFATTIRIVVSSMAKDQAKMHLDNLRAAFEQFSSNWNGLKRANRRWFKRSFMVDFIYRYQPMFGHPSILNSEELATLFHLPNKAVETPHIVWLNSKRAPAPQQIASSGLYLGKSVFRGIEKPIYIQDDDRRKHMYIIGKTGVGKSKLLESMVLQDIRAGKGVAFLDPHGGSVETILQEMPPERAEDVIYFDPSDDERPMGMNMLEAYTELQRHFVATSIIGLMYKLFDPHQTGIIGPRFEHAIRNAMLTVMDAIPGGTFIEVVQALQRPEFVQEMLPRVKDPVVRRYWTDQIAQTSDFHKSEVLDYIVSKFGRFVTNKLMRNIIGQSHSTFDFRKAMDERKILLVNLSKGKIGEENSNFLGLILVPKILIAAMSRDDIPEEQRQDFYLYVDEFQNFATETFADILSEARKFRLNLIVANQFIGQIEEEIKNAVFGNVGTIISFRVGVTDANYLQHEFQPTFSEADLINVDFCNAYIKTVVHGEPVPSFSMNTYRDLSAEPKNLKAAEMIKELSRLKYGRDVKIVEDEINKRAKL